MYNSGLLLGFVTEEMVYELLNRENSVTSMVPFKFEIYTLSINNIICKILAEFRM
jgi:DNA-binding MltR family transcriptional regulator